MAITVNAQGVQASSLEEAQTETQADFRTIFGDELAQDPQTPQGQLAGLMALLEADVGEVAVRLGNAVSVDHAAGVALFALGSLLDVRRISGRRSQVTATLTGVNGANVPAGSRARTTAGDEFRTLADVVLASTGVTVDMESVDEGPVVAAAGTLTQIVTVIPGWETITNASDAVVGRTLQTEQEYRAAYETRTAHSAVGPLAALRAALVEALAGKNEVVENTDSAGAVIGQWPVGRNAILVVAESGTDADITRAVETHRGLGCGTMAGIVGATPNETALAAVTDGTVTWNGTDYTGLNLSSATTPAQRAAALTTLLAADPVPPTVVAVDGLYIAAFRWHPGRTPNFGTGAVETAFGLAAGAAAYPAGPFVRPRARPLTVTLAVTRQPGFPADGLNLIRSAVTNVVNGYGIGEQLWLNDLLSAAEGVGGTRVTSATVQHNSTDVSGVVVPFDGLWTLPAANLTVTIT